VSGPTVRDSDGLALSSRNQYLSEEERTIAPRLYSVLEEIGRDLTSGKRNYGELEKNALETLADAGFDPEYVGIRRAENLEPPDRDCDEIVVLGAARLGSARLIDNIVVTI
jgi:pantoate--beta-alanine ligase